MTAVRQFAPRVAASYPRVEEIAHEPLLTVKSSPNRARRIELVAFVCVHWTGGDFASAVDWCTRPESQVSYHEIIAKNGDTVQLVPFSASAWANGVCKNPDQARHPWAHANSASDNIALAGGPPIAPTDAQRAQLVKRIAERFRVREWGADETWRILGHCDIAVFPSDYKVVALRGKYGRKLDPWGSGWLQMAQLRDDVTQAVAAAK